MKKRQKKKEKGGDVEENRRKGTEVHLLQVSRNTWGYSAHGFFLHYPNQV